MIEEYDIYCTRVEFRLDWNYASQENIFNRWKKQKIREDYPHIV